MNTDLTTLCPGASVVVVSAPIRDDATTVSTQITVDLPVSCADVCAVVKHRIAECFGISQDVVTCNLGAKKRSVASVTAQPAASPAVALQICFGLMMTLLSVFLM